MTSTQVNPIHQQYATVASNLIALMAERNGGLALERTVKEAQMAVDQYNTTAEHKLYPLATREEQQKPFWEFRIPNFRLIRITQAFLDEIIPEASDSPDTRDVRTAANAIHDIMDYISEPIHYRDPVRSIRKEIEQAMGLLNGKGAGPMEVLKNCDDKIKGEPKIQQGRKVHQALILAARGFQEIIIKHFPSPSGNTIKRFQA